MRTSFSLTSDGAVVFAHTTISCPGNASAPTNSSRESGILAAMLSSFFEANSCASSLAGAADLASWAIAVDVNAAQSASGRIQRMGVNFMTPI